MCNKTKQGYNPYDHNPYDNGDNDLTCEFDANRALVDTYRKTLENIRNENTNSRLNGGD